MYRTEPVAAPGGCHGQGVSSTRLRTSGTRAAQCGTGQVSELRGIKDQMREIDRLTAIKIEEINRVVRRGQQELQRQVPVLSQHLQHQGKVIKQSVSCHDTRSSQDELLVGIDDGNEVLQEVPCADSID